MSTVGAQMWVRKYQSLGAERAFVVLLFSLLAACSTPPDASGVSVGKRDGGGEEGDGGGDLDIDCNNVTIDGDQVTVQEEDVTALFTMDAPDTFTVMLFGGQPVTFDNAVSNIGIRALDQTDALALAEKYDDFYLCSSPGGIEAQNYIVQFDLVPANCGAYMRIRDALRDFAQNSQAGGDRTSLTFEGARLTLESVTFDEGGMDVTDQFADLNFILVNDVEQITGESLLEFGTGENTDPDPME